MTRRFELRVRTLACLTVAIGAAGCDSPLLHHFPAAKAPGQTGSCETTILSAPTGLAVTRVAAGEVVLAWVASGTIDGFEVERRESGGAWHSLTTLTDPSVTSYTDRAGIVADSSYDYRVAATLQSCTSAPSDVTTAYTTPPSISVGGSGWYAEATAITVTCTSGSPVALASCRYEWDVDDGCAGGATVGGSVTIPTDGAAHVLHVCAEDQLGLGARATVTLGIDATAPSITIDRAGWYSTATQVTVTTSGGGSGVAWVRYAWDVDAPCASGATYSAPLSVPVASGTLHTLYLCAQSGAGLRATTSATMAVDTTAPSITTDRSGWYTAATDVALTTTDAESGVVFTRYLWDVDDACASGAPYTAPFPVATGAGGLHTLYLCAENGAGARHKASAQLAIDATPPTLAADKSGWWPPNTTVTVTSADPESSVTRTTYRWDSTNGCAGDIDVAGPITAPGDSALHTLHLCTQNGAGVRTTTSVQFGVNTSAPTITANRSGWFTTATDVTINASAASGIAWVRYLWDSGDPCATGTTYTAAVPIPVGTGALHQLLMCAQSTVGLVGSTSASMGVDTTQPTVTADRSGWYTSATTVTVTSTDVESGVAWTRYLWDTDAACASGTVYAGAMGVPAGTGILHTLYLCVQNGAGQQNSTSATMAVDTTAPVVTVDRQGWYTSATTVNVGATDAESGVAWTRYSWDVDDACATGSNYTGALAIPMGAGTVQTLYVCAENGAGTRGTLARNLGVDTSAPTVGASVSGWQVPDTTVTITSADPQSGIAWTRYAWDADAACTGSAYTTPLAIPTSTATLHTLYMCTQSGAGTITTANATMAIDASAPTVTADRSGWYTDATSVTLTAADGESGLAWTKYAWDVDDACASGAAYTTSLSVPIGNNGLHTLFACARNNAGDQTKKSFTMGLDTTAPMISADKNGWYNGAVTITVAYRDPESGAAVKKYKWDNNSDVCSSGTDYTGPIVLSGPAGSPQHTLNLCAQAGASPLLETNTSVGIGIDLAPVPTEFAALVRHVNDSVPTSVQWYWKLNNAHPDPTCSIDHGVSATQSGETTSVTQVAPVTYTLTCSNVVATNTATTTVGIVKALASSQDTLQTLTIDDTDVYWVTGTSIRKSSRAIGGGVTDLVTGENVGVLAVDGTSLYWTSTTSNKIMKASKVDGSGKAPVVTPGQPGGLAVASGFIYWTEPATGRVRRQQLTGSVVEDIATSQVGPQELVADATSVYWVNRGGPFVQIYKGAIGSTCAGSTCTLVDDGLQSPTAVISPLKQDATHLYLVSSLLGCDHLFQYDKTFPFTRQDLYSLGGSAVTAVDTDGTTVYFATQDGGTLSQIWSVDPNANYIEGTQPDSAALSLRVANDSVYWAAPASGSGAVMVMTPR